jgi:pyruvate dehydrogenase E2 component (dihydrolipoamide acetyltransferase)
LAKWHKKAGDKVKSGDVLAEIETDKATMEVEAVDEGTLGKIVVPEGAQAVKVNAVIALLLEDGEDAKSLGEASQPAAKPAPPASAEAAPAAPAPVNPKTAAPPAPAAPQANGTSAADRLFASPLAKRMAAQAGLDIAQLKGSGPQGRIVKSDIEAALAKPGAPRPAAPPTAALARPSAPQPAAPPRPAAPAFGKDLIVAQSGNLPYSEIPHTGMRRTIARRMVESKQNVPHFNLTVDCEIDALLKMRAELNAKSTPTRFP